ncbi:hypothetical protein PF010_g32999 [Phytophthora fragariae]|uniref:Uncharacterized protein n=1 Tax=Phytophthora fragariae TaxID=53985 RepID=A0A6A3G558_9STRA|nr:hypothetical protein PF011_g32842 [Phytophthora fragariae]KAE9053220.1 hypothetical protein PF010_g32999 [Phytophthora fragariae]KAE9053766.1 hypothetical protein PF007_g32851 [Phytophthora fragariae]KAE9154879.1 hypothetical protein PF004_g32760 [Phytophthora fragariae]
MGGCCFSSGDLWLPSNKILKSSFEESADDWSDTLYFAPFGTDEPSEDLFKRNSSLEKIVPIINVAEEALNQPIPTNK